MALRVVPIVSDLQLQKCLYFSIWSGLWFGAVEIALCIFKLTQLDVSRRREDGVILPILVGLWSVLELFRIRLGYIGNLGERVPETSAFWLLTLLPQLPLAVYLGFAQGMLTPLDYAAGIPHVAITCMHLHYGLRAVRSFIRKQTRDFYRLCQEEALAAVAVSQKRPSGGPVRERPGVLLGPDGRVVPGQAALMGGNGSAQGGSSEEGAAGAVPFSPIPAPLLTTPAGGNGASASTTFSPATDLSLAYAARMAATGQPLPAANSSSTGAASPATTGTPAPVGGGIGNIAAEGARFIVKAGLSAVSRVKGAGAASGTGKGGKGDKEKAEGDAGAAPSNAAGAESAKRR